MICGSAGNPPDTSRHRQCRRAICAHRVWRDRWTGVTRRSTPAWNHNLSAMLIERMKIGRERLKVLSETPNPATAATAANVRQHLGAIRRAMTRDDLLLIGASSATAPTTAWMQSSTSSAPTSSPRGMAAVNGLQAASSSSTPRRPASRSSTRLTGELGRLVITATDSVAQRFDTVFPDFFIKALHGGYRQEQSNFNLGDDYRGQAGRDLSAPRSHIATERALLDDNGDGVGRDAGGRGERTAQLSSHVYLDEPLPGAQPTDEILVKLQKRAALELESRRAQGPARLPPAPSTSRVRAPDGRARASHQGHQGTGKMVHPSSSPPLPPVPFHRSPARAIHCADTEPDDVRPEGDAASAASAPSGRPRTASGTRCQERRMAGSREVQVEHDEHGGEHAGVGNRTKYTPSDDAAIAPLGACHSHRDGAGTIQVWPSVAAARRRGPNRLLCPRRFLDVGAHQIQR